MKIAACRPLGKMPVYDLSIDHEDHSFVHESGAVLHNCAFVIANQPIHTFIPLTTISDVRVTSYTAPSVEAVGGLKMDFLVVNSLNDLGDAIQMEQQRHGHTVDITKYKVIEHEEDLVGWGGPKFTNKRFSLIIDGKRVPCQRLVPVNGRFYDVWDLAEDQLVFADVAQSKTETVFQFNTSGATKWLRHFGHKREDGCYAINSVDSMASFTALDRPGPLDMFVSDPEDENGERKHNLLVEYARRARGAMPSSEVLKVFDELLPETYGVMVYQEQLQRVYQQLTGCSGSEAENFRGLAAKKKMDKMEKLYSPFIEKASVKIGEDNAKAAWQFFITWAKYGFAKSHATCYAVIAYACAYLKHHYSLEWWCAVLKNAAKNEVNEKFWQHCGHMIDLPDVSLSGSSFEIQNDRIRAPLSLLHGVGEGAHNQLVKYAPYKDIQDYCDKIQLHRESTSYLVRRIAQNEGKPKWVKLEGDEATKWLAATDDERAAGEVKWRLGHNALHRGITYTLIISGAMDSLFPKDESRLVHDNLADYEKALAKSGGKKKAAPVDETLVNMSPVARFQRRKAILPAYGEDLCKLLADTNHPIVQRDGNNYYFLWINTFSGREEAVRFATNKEVEEAEQSEMSPGERRQAAVVAYVEDTRIFNYGEDRREACEVILDVEGGRFKFVKWGGKAKKVPAIFKEDIKGAIVIAVLNKYKADKPFAIEDLIVIEKPLPFKDAKEEDSE